ncbi:DUF948 domain-containing protein [Pannus brasiliensis CCIBt3594]|uniref:DUF948 domain-containing protein n=1 Tax=Pannus brasiliensis CCIBt3594 TaxID=1427578 RepID=A0AAW9QVL5_9CHRO
MTEPIFWLGCSLFLVAISLTAVLVAALPALQELARAARSAEKLFDTLHREFPPTLEAIRLTGMEITQLTEEIDDGVKSASGAIQQVDRSLGSAREGIDRLDRGTRRALIGFKAAWNTWNRSGEVGE